MQLSPPNLTSEAQAKVDLMRLRGVKLEFEYYEGSGWSVFTDFQNSTYMTFFDAPTAEECVNDAFIHFLGVFGG